MRSGLSSTSTIPAVERGAVDRGREVAPASSPSTATTMRPSSSVDVDGRRAPARAHERVEVARRAPGRTARPLDRCRRAARPSGPGRRERPASISTSQSQICSSSLRSCDDTSTVRPRAGQASRSAPRISRTPCGSRPFAGSSRISSVGIAEQRGGDAEALLHAERVGAVAVVATRRRARRRRAGRGSRSSRVPPTVANIRRFSRPRERRVERRALDHRPDPRQVGGRLGRSASPSTVPGAGARAHEPEQHRHRGGLAGAVRTDEAGDDALRQVEVEPSTTVRSP